MSEETKYEKCPVCQSPLKCVGKYQTMYVYQCSGPKCRRKWNQDALDAKNYERQKHDTKKK